MFSVSNILFHNSQVSTITMSSANDQKKKINEGKREDFSTVNC